MQTAFDGPTSGVGPGYSWSGNGKVGSGSMRIVEATQDASIAIQLESLAPLEASNRTHFLLTPEGQGTSVTWTMEGKNLFVSKVMGLLMNMDQMIGATFERNLASLKNVTERSSPAR